MEALDAIKGRRSIRVFDKRIPSKEIIRECLEASIWAPSATNQQPWEFIVLTGQVLESVFRITEEKFAEHMKDKEAFGNPPEILRQRQQEIFSALLAAADEASIAPNEIFEKSMRFFNAPVAVYFVAYKGQDIQYELSTAAAIENFLIAAHSLGLGTCWLTVTTVCAEDIKKLLGIPDDRELLGGVAVGTPDFDSPLNTFDRTRAPIDDVTTWLGFNEI